MSDYTSITANLPIFSELRQGLWHCTSPNSFRQILRYGSIKPATVSRWGTKPNACQELGAVSLFDFQTPQEDRVIETVDRWGPFVLEHCTTVLVGLNRTVLEANLVPFPKNEVNTTGNVIPYVETCHCGSIPTTAITKCLLVCSVDCTRFYVENPLEEAWLAEVEREFRTACSAVEEGRSTIWQQIKKKGVSHELQARMQKAHQVAK